MAQAAALIRNKKRRLEEERNHEQGVVEMVTRVGPVVQDTQFTDGGEKNAVRKPYTPPNGSDSANIILYIGLSMVAMGLTVTFLGLGEKGFKTLELKLIGPSLVGCGMFFTVLRILFCTVPAFFSSCFACCRKKDDTEELLEVDEDEKRKLEMTMRTAMRRNGLLKPMRDTVTASNNERRNTIRQGEGPQPLVISDDDEDDDRSRPLTRPQVRPARQGVSMRRHDEDDFSDSSSSIINIQSG